MFERKIGKFSRSAELRLSWHGLIWTIFISRTIQGNEEFIFWKYSSQRNFISQWETILLAPEFTPLRSFRWCVRLHCDRMFLCFFILYIFLHFSLLHFTAEASGEYPVLGDSAEVSRRGGGKSTKISTGTPEVWKGREWVIFCLPGLFLILRQVHLKAAILEPQEACWHLFVSSPVQSPPLKFSPIT